MTVNKSIPNFLDKLMGSMLVDGFCILLHFSFAFYGKDYSKSSFFYPSHPSFVVFLPYNIFCTFLCPYQSLYLRGNGICSHLFYNNCICKGNILQNIRNICAHTSSFVPFFRTLNGNYQSRIIHLKNTFMKLRCRQ